MAVADQGVCASDMQPPAKICWYFDPPVWLAGTMHAISIINKTGQYSSPAMASSRLASQGINCMLGYMLNLWVR